ncbi:MAG: MFS transporter [Deltaproteobacteria bacterium]|nr:MFS transporter [Deltaproteobacteria bacterium]
MNRILQALKIRPGEAQKVVLMALYLFFAVSCFITGRITRDSLFLSAFSRSDLAWMYVTVAVAVPVPAYIYARYADKFRRDRIIQFTLTVFGAALLLAHFLIQSDEPWVFVVLYNFVEVLGAFLMIQFWTFAGDIFPSRAAKRLFPVIGGGGVIAGMLSGVSVGALAKVIGTHNLLLPQILLLLFCFIIVRKLGRTHKSTLQEAIVGRGTKKSGKKAFGLKGEVQEVFRSKHLKIIAGMTVATFFTVPLVDYTFKVLVKDHFTFNGALVVDELTAFMGLFYTLTGMVAAVVQFGFASRILERFGVVTSLLVLPVSLCIGSVAMIAATAGSLMAFVVGVATKGAENSFRYSINDATVQVIYTPVPGHVRGRAKTFIDGILKPWAGGVAGGAIVLMTGPLALPVKQLSYVAAVLTLVWLSLVLAIGREYVAQLLTTLRQRRLYFSEDDLSITDEATVEILRRTLKAEDAAEVRNAAELATRVNNHDLTADIVELLERDEKDLRVRALELLGSRGSMRYSEQVQNCFSDDAPEVVAAAIRAFCAIVGEPALRIVARFLESDKAEVRGAAVASLIKHGGLEGILVSAEHLKTMQASPDDDLRLAGAHVFFEIGVRNFYQPVLSLMRDKSPKVQRAAVNAAGAMQSPELIPALVYKLGKRETARVAALALIQYGEAVVVTLGKVLSHTPEDVNIRRQIPRILERIGSARCLETLMTCLEIEDPEVRREAARSAARLRSRLDAPVDEEAVTRIISAEIQGTYQLLSALDDLGSTAGNEGPDLLRDALDERVSRSLDRVFRLLGIIYPLKPIDLIFSNLNSSTKSTRSNAVEVLDNLLDKDIKRALLPLIDDMPRARVLERGQELFALEHKKPEEWVADFLDAKESWLVSVALYVVAELGLKEHAVRIEEHLDHPEPVTRETALLCLRVLLPIKELKERCEEMIDDDDEHVSRYAQHLFDDILKVEPALQSSPA